MLRASRHDPHGLPPPELDLEPSRSLPVAMMISPHAGRIFPTALSGAIIGCALRRPSGLVPSGMDGNDVAAGQGAVSLDDIAVLLETAAVGVGEECPRVTVDVEEFLFP